MKNLILALGLLLLVSTVANAQVHVDGYTRTDGTYVNPYERGRPDGVEENNRGFTNNSRILGNKCDTCSSTLMYPDSSGVLRNECELQGCE